MKVHAVSRVESKKYCEYNRSLLPFNEMCESNVPSTVILIPELNQFCTTEISMK